MRVEHLEKMFESDQEIVAAVDDVSFEVAPGEFFSLLGPSGCGKTTTLRCVAGLEAPNSGVIEVDGNVVLDSLNRVSEPAHARNLSMVFQSYAIWPHMNVFENVAFPLRHGGGGRLGRSELKRLVEEALAVVQLDGYGARMATKLSGGQQQRLALARALVTSPSLILLDEPLSNLDAGLRELMRSEIRRLQQRTGVTALYVTHDQTEAFGLSTRIAVMQAGRIVQIGSPKEIYSEPATAYVATFVGQTNLLHTSSVSESDGPTGTISTVTEAGPLPATMPPSLKLDEIDGVVVRPEDVEISLDRLDADRGVVLDGEVTQSTYLGALAEFEVQVGGALMTSHQFAREDIPIGSPVHVRLNVARCRAVTGVSDLQTQAPDLSQDDSIDLLAEEGVLPLA